MENQLPLETITIQEKLQMMEQLWEDLRRNAGELEPPAWHGETLAQRKAAALRGDEAPESWDEARQKIEKAIR
ncbi:MAG: addiction module antitoxin RelB [Gammaproteobacteria bacterium HGW-Gammaproteobacteria-8]|nr:MAG: addiction module antitoxin RelB [Gammaproteobacteria bacterium HGW-Gammaproteobacteria-8]